MNSKFESVKIHVSKMDVVRKIKERTGIPLARFIEDSIDEKIEKDNLREWLETPKQIKKPL